MNKFFAVLLIAFSHLSAEAAGRNGPVPQLREGAGKAKTMAYCAMCHSTAYIPMNGNFLDRKGWEGEVHKMVKVYGAPIQDADQAEIVDYLVNHYGPGGK